MLINTEIKSNREFKRTLYFEFTKIILISIAISLSVYFLFFMVTDFVIEQVFRNNEAVIRAEMHSLFLETEAESLDDFVEEINSEVENYEVVYYAKRKENIVYSIDYDPSNLYVYYGNFHDDVVGFVIVDNRIATLQMFLLILGRVLGLSLLLYLIRRQASKFLFYIREINDGIFKVAEGDLNYKISLKNDNELTDLADSINKMNEDIKIKTFEKEEIEKKQRQLITNVSHDLKTPLTAIIGYLDIVRTLLDKQIDESVMSYLDRAIEKSKQQQQLITKLFEYSKLINSDIDLKIRELDLNIFIRQYTELQTHEIELIGFDKKYMVMADPDLLQRVLDNLFSNIDKYGVKDAKVIISLDDLGDDVGISIENKTDADLSGKTAMMFDRTYVEETSRTSQSSGIGLSIVKEALGLMNIDIHAEFTKPYLSMVMTFRKLRL